MTNTQVTPAEADRFNAGQPSTAATASARTWRFFAFWVGLALIVVAGLAAALSLINGEETPVATVRPEDTPLISAPVEPYKVRPDAPGGMDFPHRDKFVYERMERIAKAPGVERLLPPPEEPLIPPQVVAEPLPAPASIPSTSSMPTQRVPDQAAVSPPSSLPPAAALPPALPKIEQAPPETASVSPFRVPAVKPSSPGRPVSPPPATTVPAAPGPATGGQYFIQLLASSSQTNATGAWARLQRENPSILGSLSPVISPTQRAGGSTLYRVRAGAFRTENEARETCAALKARNVDCVLVPPGG